MALRLSLCRPAAFAVLWLALVCGSASATERLEPEVAEIERLALTEHWEVSEAKIRELSAQSAALGPGQRHRIE